MGSWRGKGEFWDGFGDEMRSWDDYRYILFRYDASKEVAA